MRFDRVAARRDDYAAGPRALEKRAVHLKRKNARRMVRKAFAVAVAITFAAGKKEESALSAFNIIVWYVYSYSIYTYKRQTTAQHR